MIDRKEVIGMVDNALGGQDATAVVFMADLGDRVTAGMKGGLRDITEAIGRAIRAQLADDALEEEQREAIANIYMAAIKGESPSKKESHKTVIKKWTERMTTEGAIEAVVMGGVRKSGDVDMAISGDIDTTVAVTCCLLAKQLEEIDNPEFTAVALEGIRRQVAGEPLEQDDEEEEDDEE